jgi:N-acetylglucosamine kinase-like BadF-type ATPase
MRLGSRYFLGVDGGGTKTRFVVIDRDGNALAAHEARSAYHLQVGIEGLREVLAEGLAAVFKRAGIGAHDVAHAFFGIPAYGEDSMAQPRLDALPEELFGHARYACGNDLVCAWAGSLAAEDGINIVAGTGSGAYGERRGRTARAGGWGEVFGDEGSAYWIAVQGLNAFTRMSDGRLPRGPLYGFFRSSLGLSEDLDLGAKIMNAQTRSQVAAMAQLVTGAAREGDPVATRILGDAARELAAVIEAVRHALEFEPGEPIPLSYSGGVFEAGPLILRPLQSQLAETSRKYELRQPKLAPHVGAAIYAAKLAGQPLSGAAIERLAHSLSPASHRGPD